jgi:hypothetical protein
MNKALLDLYADYLISSFGPTTATGLSALVCGAVSHDAVTRLLANDGQPFTSRELWQLVKPLARQAQSQDAVLIVDDTIQEKPHTDENDLICWHFDHTQQKTVKGFNLLTCLYFSQEVSLPVAFELIQKTQRSVDAKTGQEKRKSPCTKNELYRQMLQTCCHNALPFRTVLNDVWFASAENMRWVKSTLQKEFVMPLKSNRKVAAATPTTTAARLYEPIEALASEKNPTALVFLEGVPFPLLLTRHVQTDKNGKECVLYLVSSDLNLNCEEVLALYQKRWKVEEYHKSLKQHAALAKSPTRTAITQTNHVFAAIYGFVKLEQLQIKTTLSHFALRARLYANALAAAFGQLRDLSLKCPA